jgi:hypothetical protein
MEDVMGCDFMFPIWGNFVFLDDIWGDFVRWWHRIYLFW